MSTHNCLNCGQTLEQNYCANCGQKASTHRFSLRHLLEHDIIHGIFHLDKGFLFTVKELLTRPGYSIREYVDGKRVKHFNSITFILLMTAFNLFLMHATHFDMTEVIARQLGKPVDKTPMDYIQKYMKEYYMVLIPYYSLITYIFFSRAKQNYAEHIVLNAYKECGNLVITTLTTAIAIISRNNTIAFICVMSSSVLVFAYSILFYKQYFSKDYRNKTLLTLRIMLMQVALFIGLLCIAVAALYIYSFITGANIVWQSGQAIIVK